MVPSFEVSNGEACRDSWALPIVAMILLAGSLAFWSLLAAFWLATQPQRPQQVMIFYPAPGSTAPVDDRFAAQPTQLPDLTREYPDDRTD